MKYFENRSKFGKSRSFSGRGNDRQMHDAVCGKCGRECQVPFRPNGTKEVLCSNCFEKSGGKDARPQRSFGDRRPSGGFELKEINAKLDRILEILSSRE